jgi:VCBS repeat-containing protein
VLDNDKDPEGKRLQVTNPGVHRGEYGYLSLLSNGLYGYVLNNDSPKVQALGQGEAVVDRFAYFASAGGVISRSELAVTIHGQNDAPDLIRYLGDVQLARGKTFAWRLPADSFKDADLKDKLTFTATLADGNPLPSWLKFDASAQSFSGIAPVSARSSLDVRVTASDGHGVFSSVSDVFRLSFGNKTLISQGALVWPGQHASSGDGWCHHWGWPTIRQHAIWHAASLIDRFFDGFRHPLAPQARHQPTSLLSWLGGSQAGAAVSERVEFNTQQHWAAMSHALQKLDTERQQLPAWQQSKLGSSLTGLQLPAAGMPALGHAGNQIVGGISGTQLKIFAGIHEGINPLAWH